MKRYIRATVDSWALKRDLEKIVVGNNFTSACYEVQPILDSAPVGTALNYRTSNRWHSCYNTYEKISEDTWTDTYEVNGEVAWSTERSGRNLASEICNSILDEKGLL